jgi:hypothetical protein
MEDLVAVVAFHLALLPELFDAALLLRGKHAQAIHLRKCRIQV